MDHKINDTVIEACSRYLPEEEELLASLGRLSNRAATDTYFARFPNSERKRRSLLQRIRAARYRHEREILKLCVPAVARLRDVVERLETREPCAFGTVAVDAKDLALLLDSARATLRDAQSLGMLDDGAGG